MAKPTKHEEFVAAFCTVARERLARLNSAVVKLEKSPHNATLVEDTMREIHTLKGEARMLSLSEIVTTVHRTEDLLQRAVQEGFAANAKLTGLVLHGLDLVDSMVGATISRRSIPARDVSRFTRRVEALLRGDESEGDPETSTPDQEHGLRSAAPPDPPQTETPTRRADRAESETRSRTIDESQRVSAATLGRLTDYSGYLQFRQTQLNRLLEDLARLATNSDKAMRQWTQTHSRIATDRLDAVELLEDLHGRNGLLPQLSALNREMVSVLSRGRDESFHSRLDLGELQDTVREIRLQRLGTVLDRFPRVARDLAEELGKDVLVRVDGAEVTADRQVIDRLEEPLMHLLRNCIDHGIESAEERIAAGKLEIGAVLITARRAGGRVEISVADDGRGIDPGTVRETALRRKLITEEEARALDDRAIINFVMQPGFSTRTLVTETSGRGIGLDVVRNQVEVLGGDVRWDNIPGEGFEIIISVPVSVVLTSTLVFRVTGGDFAIPSALVDKVIHASPEALSRTGEGLTLKTEQGLLPLVAMDALLFSTDSGSRVDGLDVVVVQHAGRRLAVEVDQLVGERQIVVHGLDPFLARQSLVNGTAVLEGGRLIQLIHVPQLFHLAREEALNRGALRKIDESKIRTLLIVEDSELTRDMLVSLARRLGFNTMEAVDGQDALARLHKQLPDLVLTDLDMPVMDGIALIEAIRADPGMRDLPVVVLSTRGSDQDKQRAMQAGANSYVTKSAFREVDFLKTLRVFLS